MIIVDDFLTRRGPWLSAPWGGGLSDRYSGNPRNRLARLRTLVAVPRCLVGSVHAGIFQKKIIGCGSAYCAGGSDAQGIFEASFHTSPSRRGEEVLDLITKSRSPGSVLEVRHTLNLQHGPWVPLANPPFCLGMYKR